MRFGLASLSLAIVTSGFLACSSDPEGANTPTTSGGSAGAGGSSGGTTGGSAGTGGTAGGGAGGTTGGSAGAGGTAGTTGGTAGSGGSGGFVGPTLLSETGLFTDVAAETLAPGVQEFTPQFQLWSDAAEKRRWVYLPEGTTIDTSNMNFWKYPVGIKLWKEFTRDGVRVETRLIQKYGDGASDWYMMAYKWNDAGTDAEAMPDGEMNSKGTAHDIPDRLTCWECHGNMADRALGFSAVQLSHDGEGLTLSDLIAGGWLTNPPAGNFSVPGDDVQKAALGYLHANCGLCHNDGGKSEPFVTIDMVLWLHADQLGGAPEDTLTYTTTVNQETQSSKGAVGVRVVPQDTSTSVLFQRFTRVNEDLKMPPVGTEDIDPDGEDIVEAWIGSLTPVP